MCAVNCLVWISEYQRAFSLSSSFLLSFSIYFFLRLYHRLEDIKILSYSALDGPHKNRSPKANINISLIKFITCLHMILCHFMVNIRTFFQLHEYKYNIKFCRGTVFKSVGELSSILSVNCLQKPCRWTVLSVKCLDSPRTLASMICTRYLTIFCHYKVQRVSEKLAKYKFKVSWLLSFENWLLKRVQKRRYRYCH